MRFHIDWMTATRIWDFLCEAGPFGMIRLFRSRAQKPFGTWPRKRSYIPWGEGLEPRQLMATLTGVYEYAATAFSAPMGMTAGPDGNTWFVENSGNQLAKITRSGTITEYTIPTSSSGPFGICTGPDGNLWFTENSANKIGKVTTSGTFTEYSLTGTPGPEGITAGPDGNLWFVGNSNSTVAKITTSGTVTSYSISMFGGCAPVSIAAGADGNLWFTESGSIGGNKIGKITTSGTITEYTVPTSSSAPYGIVSGPDGNLWFTESSAAKIGRITLGGTISEFSTPSAANTQGIAVGPDGNLWFTESAGNQIGRSTPAGTITEYTGLTTASGPQFITLGADNSLWFTEKLSNNIGKLIYADAATVPTDDPTQINGQFSPNTGNLHIDIPVALLPEMTPTGSTLNPGTVADWVSLVYNSQTTAYKPIVRTVWYSDPNGSVPTQLDARLKWNNGSWSSWTTFGTSGHSAGDAYLISLQVGSNVTATDYYPWVIEVKATFGTDTLTRDLTGNALVVTNDATASPFGQGWYLSGLDKIISVSGGVVWLNGSGGGRFYVSLGSGAFLSPPNDFGTLTQSQIDSTYTYTAKNQVQTKFDSGGKITTIVDPVGFRVTYSYSSGNLSTIKTPDNGTVTFSYDGSSRLNKVTLPGSAVVTVTQDANSHDLAGIAFPDGSLRTFTYDGNHKLTNDQWGSLSTTFAYDANNGTLSTITYDATTTLGVAPNAEQGLTTGTAQNASSAAGAVTNALGQVTTTVYDAFGQAIQVQTADGARTTLVRDSFGQVTRYIDPLGRETDFTYSYGGGKGDLVKITHPDGTTEQLQYDSTYHAPTVRIDQFGNRYTSTYDGSGRLTGTLDPFGNRTTLTYYNAGNGNGLLQTASDVYGQLTTYEYDTNHRLQDVIDPLGNRGTTGYDSYGNPNALTNIYGKTATVVYDGLHRPTTQIDVLNNRTTISYNAQGRVTSILDPLGNTTSNVYDSAGRLSAQIDALGHHTTTIYDAAGQVLATVDALGNRTSFTYDSAGRKTSVKDALGNVTTTVYDSSGAVIATIDALGNRSTINYDYAGRISSQVDPLNNRTTTTYNVNGQVNAIGNALGNTVTYDYDSHGRLQDAVDPLGDRTTTTYDTRGRPESTINALNKTTSTVYDNFGRVQATVDPMGNRSTVVYNNFGNVQESIDALGNTTTFTFDVYGRPEATVDPLGHRVTTVYDNQGRVLATIDQLNNRTTIVYDSYGRQQNLIDADNNKTTFVYDALNRVVQEIDPLGKTTTTTYNAVGRVATQIDRLGREIDFSYDAAERPTGQVWYSAPIVVEDNRLTFTFDAAGNELTAQDSHGTYTMTYDAVREVTDVQDVWGKRLTFTWDAVGNRTKVEDSAGGTTDSRFDALGNLTYRSYTESATVKLSVTQVYDAVSRTSEQYRYGTSYSLVARTSFAYDAASNLTNLQHRDGSSNNIANYTYVYDTATRLTTETRNGTTVTYTYDNSNQVTADGSVTLTYDANGNRNSGSYATGTGNQLTSDGTWTYTYDNDGNLTKKSKGANAETWTYGYDEKNELIWAKHSATDGGAIDKEVDFKYDVFGNRIEKDYDDDGAGPHSATVTRFAYDGWKNAHQRLVGNENWDVWADLDGSSSLTTRYIRGDVIDQLFARIDSGTTYWELTDRLGSVRDVVDNSAVVKDTIAYSSFGNITSESNNAFRGHYAWTGREFDENISLQYNRARWYSPDIGRWTSEDPLGGCADSNRYRYVYNHPLSAADPTGLVSTTVRPPTPGIGGLTIAPLTTLELLKQTISNAQSVIQRLEALQTSANNLSGDILTFLSNPNGAASGLRLLQRVNDLRNMITSDLNSANFMEFTLQTLLLTCEVTETAPSQEDRASINEDRMRFSELRLRAVGYEQMIRVFRIELDLLRLTTRPGGINVPGINVPP